MCPECPYHLSQTSMHECVVRCDCTTKHILSSFHSLHPSFLLRNFPSIGQQGPVYPTGSSKGVHCLTCSFCVEGTGGTLARCSRAKCPGCHFAIFVHVSLLLSFASEGTCDSYPHTETDSPGPQTQPLFSLLPLSQRTAFTCRLWKTLSSQHATSCFCAINT